MAASVTTAVDKPRYGLCLCGARKREGWHSSAVVNFLKDTN